MVGMEQLSRMLPELMRRIIIRQNDDGVVWASRRRLARRTGPIRNPPAHRVRVRISQP
jgi:hypothetical protein